MDRINSKTYSLIITKLRLTFHVQKSEKNVTSEIKQNNKTSFGYKYQVK